MNCTEDLVSHNFILNLSDFCNRAHAPAPEPQDEDEDEDEPEDKDETEDSG